MGQKIAKDEDWESDEDVKRARRELREARLWLTAQGKRPAPVVPETPLKSPEECQPAPKSPTGEEAAGRGQEGGTWESPVVTQEVRGGTQGALTGEEEREVSPPAKAGNRRVPKVVQDDQTAHPLIGGVWEGLGAVRKGVEIRIKVCGLVMCTGRWKLTGGTGPTSFPVERMRRLPLG